MRLLLSACLLAFSLVGVPAGRDEWVEVTEIEYIWLVTGPDGRELCRLITDTEPLPPGGQVTALCGEFVGGEYKAGRAYIKLLTTRENTYTIQQPLPGIDLTLTIDNSTRPPQATIIATEPLPGESIERIEVLLGDTPSVCVGSPCVIPLPNIDPTEGEVITYWANSTRGDESSHRVAMLAATAEGVDAYGPGSIPHHWRLPPPQTLPLWLQDAPGYKLYTDAPLYYLAGQIILDGRVGVPECHNWGIEQWSGGYASQCGIEHARQAVTAAQNIYNADISDAATQSGVPAWLLKNIIQQESQFWPGAHGHYGEVGLYQLSRLGADTLLRWDGEQYIMRCNWYELNYCDGYGYDNREPWQQELLISSVMRDSNDIALLGHVLTANAAQVGNLLEDYEGEEFDYLARWRITIANYHAGPALTSAVLDQLRQLDKPRTWESYADVLREMQPGVLDYIRAATGETSAKLPLQHVD